MVFAWHATCELASWPPRPETDRPHVGEGHFLAKRSRFHGDRILLQIFVDADACPVKDEVERVASRHGLRVFLVSNGGIRPRAHPLFQNITVAEGADAADDWIAEHIEAFDIAVTADVPLAARCLRKQASAIGPSGRLFTEQSIGMALGMRDLHRHLREATGQQTIHANFTRQDRSRFLGALDNEIQAIKRRSGAIASASGFCGAGSSPGDAEESESG